MSGPNYEIVERQSSPSTSGQNYHIPEGRPINPAGTGGPVNPMGTPGANYIIGTGAAALVRDPPWTYISDRYGGPVPIERMHEVWARRAARAVQEGRRPLNPRSVIRALRRRARLG